MDDFDLVKEQTTANKYYCKLCEYNAVKKFNYERHILTDKHKVNCELVKKEQKFISDKKINNFYNCECGKKYTHQTNLTRHKKTNCSFKETTNKVNVNHEEIIIMLLNENNELKKQIKELLNK